MIPTSVRVCDSNFFKVRSDVRVRVCVGVFKFCIHIRMDTFLYPDRVFKSIEVHTDNIQTDTRQPFSLKSGQNPDSEQIRERQNPDRQTSDRKSGQKRDTDSADVCLWVEAGHCDTYISNRYSASESLCISLTDCISLFALFLLFDLNEYTANVKILIQCLTPRGQRFFPFHTSKILGSNVV